MQGRRRIVIAARRLGEVVLVTALAACSTTPDAPPSAHELVGRLVDAKVCTRPRATSPGSVPDVWSCTISRHGTRDVAHVTVRSYAGAGAMHRDIARLRPVCPSDVELRYLAGRAWIAVAGPPELAAVRRTLGGHDLLIRCARRAASVTAPGPGGTDTSSTTAATTTTTAGARATSPARPYVPPVHTPAPPPAPFRIDVPPPTPAITAPPGSHPPPTEPPGTIHASGR